MRISSNRLVELGDSKSDIFIHLIDFFIEKKVWVKAFEFAEEAVSAFPKNKKLALRLAGCYLNLSRTEEGLNLLNPSSLNASEKTSFIKLFPNYGKLISDM